MYENRILFLFVWASKITDNIVWYQVWFVVLLFFQLISAWKSGYKQKLTNCVLILSTIWTLTICNFICKMYQHATNPIRNGFYSTRISGRYVPPHSSSKMYNKSTQKTSTWMALDLKWNEINLFKTWMKRLCSQCMHDKEFTYVWPCSVCWSL